MSWGIDISTDKDITEADIDAIVVEMPPWMKDKFGGRMKGTKQSWGWSLTVDVHAPSVWPNRRISCGGSCGISGNVAEPFCQEFARMIEKRLNCNAICSETRV